MIRYLLTFVLTFFPLTSLSWVIDFTLFGVMTPITNDTLMGRGSIMTTSQVFSSLTCCLSIRDNFHRWINTRTVCKLQATLIHPVHRDYCLHPKTSRSFRQHRISCSSGNYRAYDPFQNSTCQNIEAFNQTVT